MKQSMINWAGGLWLGVALALPPAATAAVPEGNLLDGVKAGPDGDWDVITVFAHPDDETFYLAGTLIQLTADPRVRLHVLCLTNGDRDRAKDTLGITPEKLAAIRSNELKAAAGVLGAIEVIEFGYPDQGLAPADQAELQARILSAINAAGAELVLTHDPRGITGHSDHVTASQAATAAFARSPAQKLIYVTMPRRRYAYNQWFAFETSDAPMARPTFKVAIGPQKKLKKLALCSHASQRHFSFFNGIAVREDLLYNYEYFAVAAEKNPDP